MKPVIIKIICWVAGIGVVGYVGLTIANSFPGISGLVGKVPVINSIPTPAIDGIAEATMLDGCKSDFKEGVEIKVVHISDAPESEGSYHRWECVAQNPNGTEEEYQKYLEELGKYKEWPRDPNYSVADYDRAECKYYDGIFFRSTSLNETTICVNPFNKYYESNIERLESDKTTGHAYDIVDYSKE